MKSVVFVDEWFSEAWWGIYLQYWSVAGNLLTLVPFDIFICLFSSLHHPTCHHFFAEVLLHQHENCGDVHCNTRKKLRNVPSNASFCGHCKKRSRKLGSQHTGALKDRRHDFYETLLLRELETHEYHKGTDTELSAFRQIMLGWLLWLTRCYGQGPLCCSLPLFCHFVLCFVSTLPRDWKVVEQTPNTPAFPKMEPIGLAFLLLLRLRPTKAKHSAKELSLVALLWAFGL